MLTEKTLNRLNAMFAQAVISSANNTDEEALKVKALYPDWEDMAEGSTLAIGQRVNYNDVLYKVTQEHQKQLAWNPVEAPSLFAKVLIPDENVIPEWEQPDSTNPYKTGDKVSYNGNAYVSLIDGNVWNPEEYPQGWELITE